MLHVAIVEDEESERAHLKNCLRYLGEKEQIAFQVSEFPSGMAFLGDYKPIYDIVLMDIEMPGMNGLETARALRQMDMSVILVFVTNMAQYAVNGYEFAMKMTRAVSRTTKRQDESIRIKGAGGFYVLRVASIKYLEVLEHYVTYHTTEGDFTEYITLKDAEKKLSKPFS